MPQAPSFWYQPSSLQATLLKPASWFYGMGVWLGRMLAPVTKVAAPVICVGNCVVGGAGKTPVVAELARRFKARGINVQIISRGYGGVLYGPVKVDPAKSQAYDVGDEPLVLAMEAPVWVAKNKVAGGVAAILDNAGLLLLDDGLQNHSLHKTASFLVMDGATGVGNGLLLPAGPLREPLSAALKRVQAVIWLGAETPLYHEIAAQKTMLRAQPVTFCPSQNLEGAAVFAFTGIAHGEKFFSGLEKAGAKLVGRKAYPDHHTWTREELEFLIDQAQQMHAIPVATAKDIARMPEDLKKKVTLCDVKIIWQDEAALETLLAGITAG